MMSLRIACLTLALPMALLTSATARAETRAGDPASFLHDTTVIARVDDRTLTVYDFRDRFYASLAGFRPRPDSAGRATFLQTLLDKEVLALEAMERDKPFTFEDRHNLRGHEHRTLINALYARAINDSSQVTVADHARYQPQFGRELRLQRIAFPNPITAERVREELVRKRIGWREAIARHGIPDAGPDGEIGWRSRVEFSGELALRVFDLELGQISPVVTDDIAYYLFRAVEIRKIAPPPPASVRLAIRLDVGRSRRKLHADRLFAKLRQREGVTYDSTAIRWLAERFFEDAPPARSSGLSLDLRGRIPEFAPADTGRVLARSRTSTFSLGTFLTGYRSIPAALRPRIYSLDMAIPVIDRMLLEPQMADEARARGLERDSLFLAEMAKKREQIQVEHLYEDSVASRVSVLPDDRRRFYRENRSRFVTQPWVRYARFLRHSEAGADSLIAALRAGASAESIAAAQPNQGSVTEHFDHETLEFRRILMEELKPGQASRVGPDPEGKYLVLMSLEYRAPREQPYEEVQNQLDESVYNLHSERALKAFLDRRRPRHQIRSIDPGMLMRINLRDPAVE